MADSVDPALVASLALRLLSCWKVIEMDYWLEQQEAF